MHKMLLQMEAHPVMTDTDGRIWSTSSRYCSCIILECGTVQFAVTRGVAANGMRAEVIS